MSQAWDIYSYIAISELLVWNCILSHAVFPGRYFYRGGNPIISVNGSSEDGNCSLLATTTCIEPTTSFLQDGIIPTLTGLDGDMWASQLLTINTDSPTTDITFDFEAAPGYFGVRRVEVVMFNCPEWGISVDSITLYESTCGASIRNILATISPTITSCDSLVRVCISRSVSSTLTALTLRFHLSSASTWVHLAEVSFGPTCQPDSILDPIPPTPSLTSKIYYMWQYAAMKKLFQLKSTNHTLLSYKFLKFYPNTIFYLSQMSGIYP